MRPILILKGTPVSQLAGAEVSKSGSSWMSECADLETCSWVSTWVDLYAYSR